MYLNKKNKPLYTSLQITLIITKQPVKLASKKKLAKMQNPIQTLTAYFEVVCCSHGTASGGKTRLRTEG